MEFRSRWLAAALTIAVVAAIAAPASAAQLGAGLHYLRTLEEIEDQDEFDENAFALFGTVTLPFGLISAEGNVEFVPDYLGTDHWLIQPAAYGFVNLGLLYGGAGIGIGYLNERWASNPYYALRAGVNFGLGGLSLDAFTSYRFQSATFEEATQNFDMDALTFAAQIKFGG